MFHPLKLLAQLPKIRKGLLAVLCITGLADFLTSIILLAYQLALTTGFNHVVPSLVVTSFLTTSIPIWFLYSKPYAIRLPVSSSPLPAVGSRRDLAAKFTRSILAELIALGGVAAWTLVTVSALHAETPGLIDNCGGWTICRMLLAVLSLTWISFLFQCLSFASLLVSTLYFSIRRHSPIPTLFTSFDQVDWIRYSGRPVDRSATVKRTRVKQSKQNTDTIAPEQDEDELKAPSRSRFGERPDSQVPVLARSIHSTMGSIGGGGNDSITIDWDQESSFRNSIAETTNGRTTNDQVFILVEEKEEELEEKHEMRNEKEKHESTGTAM
ncbi:uncharacterized protein JCM6883_002860 [Sporobolomyces salmoneus]|uniref:uncharacterized protein n=1 Tax=Sporobolomyces salmoneus TaxID=183962 RepID=UPI0031813663